jgi:hypothetical protein
LEADGTTLAPNQRKRSAQALARRRGGRGMPAITEAIPSLRGRRGPGVTPEAAAAQERALALRRAPALPAAKDRVVVRRRGTFDHILMPVEGGAGLSMGEFMRHIHTRLQAPVRDIYLLEDGVVTRIPPGRLMSTLPRPAYLEVDLQSGELEFLTVKQQELPPTSPAVLSPTSPADSSSDPSPSSSDVDLPKQEVCSIRTDDGFQEVIAPPTVLQ